jgi:hypothetical protein
MCFVWDDLQARHNANAYRNRPSEGVRGAGTILFGYPCFVYGRDDYSNDARARHEVALLREHLDRVGIPVLGFGVSDDGHTWLMIVGSADDDLVQRLLTVAWREAFDVPD